MVWFGVIMFGCGKSLPSALGQMPSFALGRGGSLKSSEEYQLRCDQEVVGRSGFESHLQQWNVGQNVLFFSVSLI